MKVVTKLPTLKCPECGHKWTPRVQHTTRCPKCFKIVLREETR